MIELKHTLTLALLLASGIALADEEIKRVESPYVPDFDGKAMIHCKCAAATSGCALELFWKLQGEQTHEWWQEVSFQQGKAADLEAACYRKRDVDRLGDGFCCAVLTNEETPTPAEIHRVFAVTEVRKK